MPPCKAPSTSDASDHDFEFRLVDEITAPGGVRVRTLLSMMYSLSTPRILRILSQHREIRGIDATQARLDMEKHMEERQKAIDQIKTLMSEYGLSVADLSSRAPKKSGGGGKVAAKFRNKATGEAWSGRGLQPRWLKAALASGKKLADFAV